jgi:hypothetical protein
VKIVEEGEGIFLSAFPSGQSTWPGRSGHATCCLVDNMSRARSCDRHSYHGHVTGPQIWSCYRPHGIIVRQATLSWTWTGLMVIISCQLSWPWQRDKTHCMIIETGCDRSYSKDNVIGLMSTKIRTGFKAMIMWQVLMQWSSDKLTSHRGVTEKAGLVRLLVWQDTKIDSE